MFIVLMKLTANKPKAPGYMADHNAWLAKGFDDGVFVFAGSILPDAGGVILARGMDRPALESRLRDDPFVAEDIVAIDILEVDPKKVAPALETLAS